MKFKTIFTAVLLLLGLGFSLSSFITKAPAPECLGKTLSFTKETSFSKVLLTKGVSISQKDSISMMPSKSTETVLATFDCAGSARIDISYVVPANSYNLIRNVQGRTIPECSKAVFENGTLTVRGPAGDYTMPYDQSEINVIGNNLCNPKYSTIAEVASFIDASIKQGAKVTKAPQGQLVELLAGGVKTLTVVDPVLGLFLTEAEYDSKDKLISINMNSFEMREGTPRLKKTYFGTVQSANNVDFLNQMETLITWR
jgi:hypothetical protein